LPDKKKKKETHKQNPLAEPTSKVKLCEDEHDSLSRVHKTLEQTGHLIITIIL